jgi:hypothetical protein
MKSGDDQEVAGEPHLHDHVELGFEPRVVTRAVVAGRERIFLQPLFQAVARFFADPTVERVILGHRKRRQIVGAERQFEIAAFRQIDRVVDRVRRVVREQRGHFLRGFQILLRAVIARAFRIVEHAARGDAHARFVRVEPVGVEKTHIVAGDGRDAALPGGVQGEGVERLFVVEAAAGELQMQAVVEMPLPVGQPLQREVVTMPGRQRAGLAVAPDQREQALVGLGEPLRAHHHAVVTMALHPRAAKQAR